MLKLIARAEQRKYAGFDPKVDASAELTKERMKERGRYRARVKSVEQHEAVASPRVSGSGSKPRLGTAARHPRQIAGGTASRRSGRRLACLGRRSGGRGWVRLICAA